MPHLETPPSRNHYQVLGLPFTIPACLALTAHDIRQAYKRALLQHHPDKHASIAKEPTSKEWKGNYSIDDITRSYRVLQTPSLQAEHNRQLRFQAHSARRRDVYATCLTRYDRSGAEEDNLGRCGLEPVDLDDLAYDEEEGIWYEACRCGLERGFIVREADLEEVMEKELAGLHGREPGRGDIVVGCKGCSLWIVVAFGVLGEAEAEESEGAKDG